MSTQLTLENAKTLIPGTVVKIERYYKEKLTLTEIGVVCENDYEAYAKGEGRGCMICNCEDGTDFYILPISFRVLKEYTIRFEIIHDHAPVKEYDYGYDFVSGYEKKEKLRKLWE